MAMTDISFQDVPKKFRYYAKSLMKIAPSVENIKRETITSVDEDSGSCKSDDKCDVSCTSKGNSPGEKNVLPTPPGSPEEALNWNSASECKLPPIANPESLISNAIEIERHRILDLQLLDANGGGGGGGGVGGAPVDLIKKDFPETVGASVPHNYLRTVTPGVPFIAEDLESEDHHPHHHHHHHHAHTNFQPDVNLPFSTATDPIIARALASGVPKRLRTEKKPIPCEQKDDKYFERRKRNNHAAKKSRDARKHREDQIAVRANLLEKENAILRAQVSTLRDEANSLRQLLIQKRHNRSQ